MKSKLIFNGAIFILIIGIYQGCKKETHSEKNIENSNLNYTSRKTVFESQDAEDATMNDLLEILGLGVASFGTDESLMNIIYNEAATSPNHEVKYSKLISIDGRFRSLLNTYLKANGINPKPGEDSYQLIVDSMEYKGVDYYPNIVVSNIDVADKSNMPIIAIGVEVDDNDGILGYKIHKDGKVTSLTVSEHEGFTSKEPIIIINNGTDHVEHTDDPLSYVTPAPPPSPQGTHPSDYFWYGWKINPGYRYEGGCCRKSELRFAVTMHDNNNYYNTGVFGDFPQGEYRDEIAKVSASDINNGNWNYSTSNGTALFVNIFSAANTTAYPYAYITTFEYDWYASGKVVDWCFLNVPSFGILKYHSCKMKYSNEWYHNTLCQFNLTMFMPGLNYIAGYGGYKSTYQLKRSVY
jgi:hypothetical protein